MLIAMIAITNAEKAIEIDPSYIDARCNAASIGRGQYEKALKHKNCS